MAVHLKSSLRNPADCGAARSPRRVTFDVTGVVDPNPKAESSGPTILTGDWNRALVGPDPSAPLSGGGSGGVEEVRNVLGSDQSRRSRPTCSPRQGSPRPTDPTPPSPSPPSSRGCVRRELSSDLGVHTRQRRKVKPYRVGDTCEVWSKKYNAWILDGDVIQTVDKECLMGDMKVRAGSMKVVYMDGQRCKWVALQDVEEHLRRSPQPAPQPWAGTLLKEVHAEVVEWHAVHVEIHKGFIQWWEDEEAAARGYTPIGHAYLLAVQQGNFQGPRFSLRAVGRGGAVDTFQASTEEDAGSLVDRLWEHAGYCLELEELRVGTTSSAGNLGGA